jgi:hypothetical protein
MLGSASGKGLRGGKYSPHYLQSRKPAARFGEFNQPLFAPFFIPGVHRFGNSIRKKYDQIVGFMRKDTSVIPLRQEAYDRSAGFEP